MSDVLVLPPGGDESRDFLERRERLLLATRSPSPPPQRPVKSCTPQPRIAVHPLLHDHGHLIRNLDRGHRQVTVTNLGAGPLAVGQLRLVGPDAAHFRIHADGVSGHAFVQDAHGTVTVSVSSNRTGHLAALLEIPSNDPALPLAYALLMARVSGRVVVVISVDWEGLNLLPANLDAMEQFRLQFPAVPLTHFVSAGYFTRSRVGDWPVLRSEMRRAMLPIDEIGVHVHCWHALLENAGVAPSGNDDWGPGADPYFNIWGDGGHANPITDYTAGEVRTIVEHSRQALQVAGGFNVSRSYRSGGWVMNAAVQAGVYAAGFRVDSSAVPPAIVAGQGLADVVLAAAWGAVATDTQPYYLPFAGGGRLKEVPDNGALADYIDVAGTQNLMDWALQQQGDEPLLLQTGFHQETAAALDLYDDQGVYIPVPPQAYLGRIAQLLGNWSNDVNTWPELEFLTVEQAAARFLP